MKRRRIDRSHPAKYHATHNNLWAAPPDSCSGGLFVGPDAGENPLLRKLWSHWLVLARKIGQFQSRIILTLFYFVLVTPFALITRLFTDPLHIRRRSLDGAQSGWVERKTRDVDLAASQKQF
jgi:hypothetical protein